MAQVDGQIGVVLVHGLLSSPDVWDPFRKLLDTDRELSFVTPLPFEYSTPYFRFNPLRRIPSFDDIADSLQMFLRVEAGAFDDIVLVSHSQGGLIVQRHLHRMLSAGRGAELTRIRLVCTFACPNSGAELLHTFRRRFVRKHPQERELRPLNALVAETHSTVINRVVHAERATASTCPIPFRVYAGESDNIVTPTSARGAFPGAGVLPGDHSTLVRPDSVTHRSYTTLRADLTFARDRAREAVRSSAPAPSSPDPEPVRDERRAERNQPSIRIQENNASDNSQVFAVQDGRIDVHQGPQPPSLGPSGGPEEPA
ncbi:alpha/beta fold hydrolase [Streptomyces zhihengii]|uniref:esterase/lipase family protein n=1 Tax=Streptomyces zhihengii TaxID=1818004 RepID=UPI00345459F9